MNPFSKKTLQRIASGEVKLSGRSTIKRKPVEVLMAKRKADQEAIRAAINGAKAKPKKNGHDARRIAKARAWTQFSMFIRLRDADAFGRVQCITCQRSGPWKQFDAGHYLTRAKESTLFDEHNVHAQCKGCNRFQGGKFFEHEQAIVRKYGALELIRLKNKAGQECKRTLFDYQTIEKNYAERVAWIKQHEPGKFKPTSLTP